MNPFFKFLELIPTTKKFYRNHRYNQSETLSPFYLLEVVLFRSEISNTLEHLEQILKFG